MKVSLYNQLFEKEWLVDLLTSREFRLKGICTWSEPILERKNLGIIAEYCLQGACA